jgi:hypothetical protein
MEIKPVEELIAEIKLHYDRDPLGWKFLRGRDQRGHYDTYIMNKKNLWQMKTEFKNPYSPKGVGLKVLDRPSGEIEFLMEEGEALVFGEFYKQQKDLPIITTGIGRYSPRASRELKGIISTKQNELERTLSESLDRVLHREGICREYL